jgi:hypothetical protein
MQNQRTLKNSLQYKLPFNGIIWKIEYFYHIFQYTLYYFVEEEQNDIF